MELRGLAWWGPDHLVLHHAQGWQVRSWPAGTLVAGGGGLAIPHPDGRRWAVTTGAGVEVDGVLHPLPGGIRARSGCWWRDGVYVARTDPRGGQSLSELWWVSAEGGPVRLADAPPGHRFHSVTTLNDCLLTELYRHGNAQSVHQVRVLQINGPGDAVDAVPDLDGSIHQLLMTPAGSRVVLWSADPNFTQHILIETAQGWQPVTPELRVTGRCQPLASGELLITAYDGIRAGLATIDPDKRVWRWALTDPAASFLPIAVHPEGQVAALRRPADGTPTLISFAGETTREVLSLPELQVPPARVLSWDGPSGPLEGLFVSPPGLGPWPLVVDLHGGPNHTLIAGYAHELDRWRHAGMAAIAPEYAAAGIGGSDRRATAWGHPGPAEQDPNVQDVASAIAAVQATGTVSGVFLFGWSWGGALVNRLVTTGTQYQAAVSWEGVADLRLLDERMGGEPFRRSRWGTPTDNPDVWERASAISHASAVRTPMLLLHGETGCPEQGQAWQRALQDAGVPVELWIYPGGHLPDPDVVQEIYARAAAWFRRWS